MKTTGFQITLPKVSNRNAFALHAMGRKAGAMKHKAAPRGGGRNEQRDLLEEAADELEDADAAR